MDNQTYNQAKRESRPSSLGHDRASADFNAVYNSIVSFIWGIADIRALEAETEGLLVEVLGS